MAMQTINTFFIPGPAGNLEAILTESEPAQSPVAIAIVCHPHSLHGGTMNNKVVTTTVRAMVARGISAIRFNFRGVGASSGQYDAGSGETDDLLAVVDWVKQQYSLAAIYLAGFSFGSYVAYRAAHWVNPQQLILIAPPVIHFTFNDIPPPACPCLIIQGEQDEVVDPQAVYQWVADLQAKALAPVTLVRFPDTGHFFHSKLRDLQAEINLNTVPL